MSHEAILHASQATGIPIEDITGRNRFPRTCYARFVIMEQLRAKGLSLATIGRLLNRHHSTVLIGLRQAKALRGTPTFDKIRSSIA